MLSNKQIQINLTFLGFNCGKTDGKIGIKTRSAIKSFQKSFELTRDGKWGNETNTKCIAVVKDIQRKIGCKNIDGIVGSETIDKTMLYQKLNNLKVDGIAGVNTRAKMNQSEGRSWAMYPHFKQTEFACRDKCGFMNENLKVVEILEDIRSHFGNRPVIITSGCRCVRHNNKVGGVKGSKHLSGEAADFYVKGVSTQALLNYTTLLMHKGKIKYTYTNNKNMKGVVHINI